MQSRTEVSVVSQGQLQWSRCCTRRLAGRVLVVSVLLTTTATTASSPPLVESATTDSQNWFARQTRKFRSYPHLDRAYRLMAQERFDAARHEMEQYLAVEPGIADPWLSYGELLYRLKDYTAAVDALDRALKIRPDRTSAVLTRAMALHALGKFEGAAADFATLMRAPAVASHERIFAARAHAGLALTVGNARSALDALAILEELNPEVAMSRQVLVLRAQALHSLGRLDESDAAYEQALRKTTGHEERVVLLAARGDLATERNDVDTRRTSFAAALELEPNNRRLLRAMADLEASKGRADEAIVWLQKTLAVQANREDRLFLVELLAREKRYEEVTEQLSYLLKAESQPEQKRYLLLNRGHVAYALARYVAAAEDFREAAAVSTDGAVLSALAYALEKADDPKGAAVVLDELVGIEPTAANVDRLGELLLSLGQRTEALAQFARAVELEPSSERHQRLGHLLSGAGDLPRAVAQFERASALGASAAVDRSLGALQLRLGDATAASLSFERSLARGLPSRQAAEVWLQLAEIYREAGHPDRAIVAMEGAVATAGSDWRPHQELAVALTSNGDHLRALGHYLAVAKRRGGGVAMLQVASCLHVLGRHAEALGYYMEALKHTETLSLSQRKQALDGTGHLHALRGERPAALAVWQRSLELSEDSDLAVHVAALQRELARLEAAEGTLTAIRVAKLTPAGARLYWDEMAHLYRRRGEGQLAIDALRRADSIEQRAEHSYRLGLLYQSSGDVAKAVVAFEQALERAPNTPIYIETLAHAQHLSGNGAAAAELFRQARMAQPERSDLQQNLAYAFLSEGRVGEAAQAFREAIDMRYASLEGSPAYRTSGMDPEIIRMRQEVANLELGPELTLYHSYRDDEHGRADAGRGLIPSQGGIEYSQRLPSPGVGHSLEVFGRVLGGAESGSFALERESLQGGVGVRFRPFASHNVYVAAERLIKIGDEARHDWLIRGSYGWSPGYALRPGISSWNYTSVYLDAGYFTEDGIAAYFGELRQGWTFNVRDRLMVTPHLTLSGRHLNPDAFDDSYREGGVGISLRYLFNQSRHAAPRSSVEILLQYKEGIGPDRGEGGGWALTTVFRL